MGDNYGNIKIKVGVGLAILAVIASAAFVAFTLPAPQSDEETPVIPPAGPITITGEMVCLPHSGGGEMQTMECAFGLKDTEGRYFALADTDPAYTNVSNAPMGTPVSVEGTFRLKTAPDNYVSLGVIEVKKITPATATTPNEIRVSGKIICLPHKGDGPTTLECRYGIETVDGTNYALDLQSITLGEPLEVGETVTLEGRMTPIELISSDMWQAYDIKGILSVHAEIKG